MLTCQCSVRLWLRTPCTNSGAHEPGPSWKSFVLLAGSIEPKLESSSLQKPLPPPPKKTPGTWYGMLVSF